MRDAELPYTYDVAPGDERHASVRVRMLGYVVGLALAVLLTATSFFIAGTNLVWQPSIPIAIIVLAIAQMGVHLVIVLLVISGSLWIMANLNQNMMPMDQIMQMQR